MLLTRSYIKAHERIAKLCTCVELYESYRAINLKDSKIAPKIFCDIFRKMSDLETINHRYYRNCAISLGYIAFNAIKQCNAEK